MQAHVADALLLLLPAPPAHTHTHTHTHTRKSELQCKPHLLPSNTRERPAMKCDSLSFVGGAGKSAG
jgi:hypothetical protein